MKDAQAILHEIVNDLEKTATGLDYALSELQRISPRTGFEAKDLMKISETNNRKFYDGLREKIQGLT